MNGRAQPAKGDELMHTLALRSREMILLVFTTGSALGLLSCANSSVPGGDSPDELGQAAVPLDENGRPVGWEARTHDRDATPDYQVVFPEDKVNRLDITITSEAWKAMQDDMTEIYGEPGRGDQGGLIPGAPGQGGFPGGVGGVPDEILQACAGMQEGDACTAAFGGTEAAGSCTALGDGQLACVPEGGPGGFGGAGDGAPGPLPGDGFDAGGPLGSTRNPIYVPSTVEYEGATWWYVGIRFKGQSSLTSSWSSGIGKLPLRLDFDQFEGEHPEIDNQRFYGFKELSLASNWSDSSLLREKVAHDIFREAGVPAPRTAFYRVYIDFGEGPQYFGLYTATETPDKPMLDAQFGAAGGNLYKPNSTWVAFKEEDFDKETNEDEGDWSDVQAAIAALHADRSDPESWQTGLEATLNVDGFIHWLAVNTVIQNWDTYGNMAQNYYLYANPAGGSRLNWIPWDNNMALAESAAIDNLQAPGGVDGAPGAEQAGGLGGLGRPLSLSLDEVDENWPLIRFLMDDPVYWGVYVSYVQHTIDGAFAVEPTRARYQAAHDLIAPYAVGSEGEEPGYTFLSDPQKFDEGLQYLLDHVARRNQAALDFLEAAR
jgi:hypothetical protein